MKSLERVNLAQIERTYFAANSPASRGRKLIEKTSAPRLARLLRHHEEASISDAETWQRDYVDYLIAFYSMVEVACIAGFLPRQLPEPHREVARRELGNEAVRRYHEKHYPLVLPRLHLARSINPANAADGLPPGSTPEFEEFFALSQPIEFGAQVETFLWFLDGGWRDGYDMADTIEAIGTPSRFFACMAARPRGADELDNSVQGFTIYLAFCRELHALLERTADRPLVQSAMWHYHGYWFDHMRERFGTKLREALDQFQRWEEQTGPLDSTDRAILAAARHERRTLGAIIRAMVARKYGKPLRDVAKRLVT
jgi:hypothetical protein